MTSLFLLCVMSLRLCENFDYLSQASLFFFKITGKRESCLPLFFSHVQELEATLYPLVSVCMCVCMYVCVCVSIDCFFAYKSQTNDWIMMILRYKIDIYETKKLT